ncbi:MAG: helix-turn-helix domain-containing protein, partial [Saprospiraceae bacterium]
NEDLILHHEGVYLIGMMNRYGEHFLNEHTSLFGIRFRPGALSFFYNYESLHHLANRISEFHQNKFPDIRQVIKRNVAYLDGFFLNRLTEPRNSLAPILLDIQNRKGQLVMDDLIRKHLITARQLERYFQSQVGISPKAFMNIVRFTDTMQRLKQRKSGESIMEIAFDCGYYDHAHLSRDIRQYTGMTPGQIILSDFSKLTV